MGRKERSNIVRIEKATRASKRKYTSSLQEVPTVLPIGCRTRQGGTAVV